jgi:hypothetical protein
VSLPPLERDLSEKDYSGNPSDFLERNFSAQLFNQKWATEAAELRIT